MTSIIVVTLFAQLAVASPQSRETSPVLAFPESGLDDSAAYHGYQTRLFKDAAGNTVQIYLDTRSGRVVHLWADAENESIGFTARSGTRPAPLRWDSDGAIVSASPDAGRTRALEYRLAADAPRIHVGLFLLGSMRVERDFQYAEANRTRFTPATFSLPEIARMLAALERLDPAVRSEHLALLNAPDIATLRGRLRPAIVTDDSAATWVARVIQPSLDARDTITLEIRADTRLVTAARAGDSISLAARSGSRIPFAVRITTTGRPLTPLTREEIFSPAFLTFLAAVRDSGSSGGAAATRARWLERQVRGVELLSSHEKLMAGLPTYATYFGRDMLVSALMMRSIWRPEMSEFAVGSALRKLSPTGQVSHEEALGGQAVREGAAEYAALVDEHFAARRAGNRNRADSLLARAGTVVRELRRTRENYHMVDDELQLPILAARWLVDSSVPADRKRAFLTDSSDGSGTRLVRLLRELGLVARMTSAYVQDPVARNLVSFAPRDSGRWASSSWRDSGAGYGGGLGRYAMDVNAIWAPYALESLGQILGAIRGLGFSLDSLSSGVADLDASAPLGQYARDSTALRQAVDRWRGASRHFVVRLSPAQVRSRVTARLAAMPAPERAYWRRVLTTTRADQDSLTFLALSLDAAGRPIGVANSDPATRLFLAASDPAAATDSAQMAAALRDVRLFVRAYPVGLFIDRVGPVVANDAYTTPAIWRAFERDHYHGPRVVWGREVNLFLLGTAGHVAEASALPAGAGRDAYTRELRDAIERIRSAVEASGFRSELWTYTLRDGRMAAMRYGIGADVQLWSTTDLAVQFALSQLGR
ncbi:MAG TPA: hypothetical protein VFZ21_29075 [Gemmatimonadaceae bacterium]|nr:hypothetical protein [Gemmatimonadaceae bacterium]